MNNEYNIYCDESCHLQHDRQSVMVLGAIWCLEDKARESAIRIREIKSKHDLSVDFEIKWTKVSPAKIAFYRDLIDYFFDDDDLHFRAVIADKTGLDHEAYIQDHDTWYYKMYFLLLEFLLTPKNSFNIYLDIKDTRSQVKVAKLHEILCNSKYDFDRRIIKRIQQVRSHEIEQIQLVDLLIGGLAYVNRELTNSDAKLDLIERIKQRSGYSLKRKTLLGETKFNIFHWEGTKP